MLRNGFLTIGRWRGIPIRVHWATPLGALLLSGFRFVPAFWAGFFLLILLHELGHAFVVLRAKAAVLSVDVLPFGGLCTWSGPVSRVERACIAWGGVWAQMLLLAGAWAWLAIEGRPQSEAGAQLMQVFTRSNLWIIGLNLLPVQPLDGAEAWKLIPLLKERMLKRLRIRRYTRDTEAARQELRSLDEKAIGEDPSPEVKRMVDDLIRNAKEQEKIP